MLDMNWVPVSQDMEIEVIQSRDEGRDVTGFLEKAAAIKNAALPLKETETLAIEFFDEIGARPVMEQYPYREPETLEEIRHARPSNGWLEKLPIFSGDPDATYDRIYGAWLGRCCGCLLGQPVEGWRRERIVGLLKDTGNYPIRSYLSSNISPQLRGKYGVIDEKKVYGGNRVNWLNNISCMPEDDDTNYTLLSLVAMETHGFDFTPEHIAELWMEYLPFSHVCTAERVAYRNFVQLIPPPQSAAFCNPYREWIGAQIRTDLYGYVTPGNPELGAELAYRDASISHTKNGVYGAMFVSAMLSAAAMTQDVELVIQAGLSQIPEASRLYEAISQALVWSRRIPSWEQALEEVHMIYDEANPHHWCHTISNAVIVALSLLYGDLSLEKTIGIAVTAGFDTDCNAATAGSVMGMMLGAKHLPEAWVSPLNDQIKSGVSGFGVACISDMAARTVALLKER